MGIVYLAKDPLIGRLVALKTIRPAAHSDDDETKEFQQRFIREAQAAGILNHPAIVTVHDIGLDDSTGMSFIAMEYVEGQNVKEILAQGRALSFDQIGDIVGQIADALDFAHSKGIVHRDVKPANIIILDGNRAKITDFGIAKIASGVANLTSTGQFLGTPNYMAPEQIKGAPVDGRTDIFSLGICLYECLTRRKPFGGDSLTSISYKIVHEPFPPLHEINPQIPDGYNEVVSFCLAKDPAKRYQRAKDLATALRSVLRGEKPMKSEPILEEETIITRDRDRLPTIDVPFPDAEGGPDAWTTQAAKQGSAAGSTPAAPRPAAKGPRLPSVPIREKFNQTFNRVRTHPTWRSRISPYLVAIIIGMLIALLAGAVVVIQRQKPKVATVDQHAEQRRARERQLREEGNALLRQGRVHEAYAKFEQLNKMAPASPAVSEIVQKLDAIRQKEEITKQQVAFAKQKRDEGIDLVNQRKFPEAIAVLQESYTANPTDDLTMTYLRLAQVEQQKAEAENLAKTLAASSKAPPGTGAGRQTTTVDPRPASNVPAQLTTSFNGPFTDGYIMVKVGAETVAHENLFEEKGRFIRRNVPRPVSVTSRFPPRDTDVQIWVVVPSQKITEHKAIRHNFKPGSAQRLQVTFNPTSKTFDYQLN
jgi:serine/threonine protein kinase/predicted negative regulator of RcsB-dependent stress response